MIEKTVRTIGGKLTIRMPASISEITLGQVMQMQEKPMLNDLEVISILSGTPLSELQNIRSFDDLYVFGEIILLLSKQFKNLYANDKIPKRIIFRLTGGSKTVNVMQNLAVEPAGAFFAAREIIAEEIKEHTEKYGADDCQSNFNPSLKACCQVLAYYFYCPVTNQPYNEYKAEEFNEEIKKLRVMEALPIAVHFFRFYPLLSKAKTGCLSRLRQRWKKKQESALLKSLSISIP